MRIPALLLLLGAFVACGAGAPRAEETVASARSLLAASRLPEAREPLESLLKLEPDNMEAALLLADVYHGLGRHDRAVDLLEPFLERHPDNARLVGAYGGQCMLRAGELGFGIRALRLARRGREQMERAVTLAPKEIAYREGLVDFYRHAPSMAGGDLGQARRHADAIARIDPVRGGAWLASILVQEKKFPEALAACDTALAARPDDYVALFTLGRTVAESGLRLDDGEAALRRCLERAPAPSEPRHADVWFRLGLIAEHRGDHPAARAAYGQSLKLEPGSDRAAEALKRLGESD